MDNFEVAVPRDEMNKMKESSTIVQKMVQMFINVKS